MFNVLGDISVLALLVAFVAYFVLGGVWFAAVFSKQYKASLGRAADAPQPSSLLFIVGPALCTAVVVVASSVLIEALDITAVGDAVVFALIVGIGYLVANTVNIAINPNMLWAVVLRGHQRRLPRPRDPAGQRPVRADRLVRALPRGVPRPTVGAEPWPRRWVIARPLDLRPGDPHGTTCGHQRALA